MLCLLIHIKTPLNRFSTTHYVSFGFLTILHLCLHFFSSLLKILFSFISALRLWFILVLVNYFYVSSLPLPDLHSLLPILCFLPLPSFQWRLIICQHYIIFLHILLNYVGIERRDSFKWWIKLVYFLVLKIVHQPLMFPVIIYLFSKMFLLFLCLHVSEQVQAL